MTTESLFHIAAIISLLLFAIPGTEIIWRMSWLTKKQTIVKKTIQGKPQGLQNQKTLFIDRIKSAAAVL